MSAYSLDIYPEGSLIDAIYVHAFPYGSSRGALKVNIPSLMPSVPLPGPRLKVTPEPILSSVYDNSRDCKPSVAKKIYTQNYFVAQPPNFPYQYPIIDYGAKLKVTPRIVNGNLEFKLVSEEMDPSREP